MPLQVKGIFWAEPLCNDIKKKMQYLRVHLVEFESELLKYHLKFLILYQNPKIMMDIILCSNKITLIRQEM